MLKRLKTFLTYIALYITVVGLLSFSCFILEESAQVATFATFPAKNAQAWDVVLEGCDIIDGINTTLKIINYSIGWIQPLAFISYRAYSKGTDYYVKALKTEAFAKAPHAFVGRHVKFEFTPKQVQQEADHVRLINGKIHVLTDQAPNTQTIPVQGIVQLDHQTLVIDTRK